MKRSCNDRKCRLALIRNMASNENGAALIIGLMFVAILGLVGTTAVIMTTTDMKIGGNYKTSVQASNVAEAGINEALYRLSLFDDGGTAEPPSGSMINVNNITSNNAAISIDPNGLLSDGIDNDENGAKDDISDLNYNGTYDNRNWKAVILLSADAPAGLIDNTTFYTNTIQPSASWLEYSSSTDDGTALTIEFLKDTEDMDKDGDTAEIVFYDGNATLTNPYNVNSAGSPATGQPVVVITSKGRTAQAKSEIRVGAVHQPININGESAVMVDLSPTLTGSAIISGFNYDGSTTSSDCAGSCGASKWDSLPSFCSTNDVDNHGGPESYTYPNPSSPPPEKNKNWNDPNIDLFPATPTAPNNEEELGTEQDIPYGSKLEASGHKPGVWTTLPTDTVSPQTDVFGGDGGDDSTVSSPPIAWKKEAVSSWPTLAEVLGVFPETLTKILAGANVTEADMDNSGKLTTAPQGVIYINNLGGNELHITSSTPKNDEGWGLLYVTGDVDFQELEFKGLIYVEGDANVTGSFWLLGCIAIKGVTSGDFSAGNGTFLYSRDALGLFVNKGMKFIPVFWNDMGLS
jgi:hypothetical protein